MASQAQDKTQSKQIAERCRVFGRSWKKKQSVSVSVFSRARRCVYTACKRKRGEAALHAALKSSSESPTSTFGIPKFSLLHAKALLVLIQGIPTVVLCNRCVQCLITPYQGAHEGRKRTCEQMETLRSLRNKNRDMEDKGCCVTDGTTCDQRFTKRSREPAEM